MTDPSITPVRQGALTGFSIIIASTVFAGIASYVVTWLVPRVEGFSTYALFAVFWSFIYLVVGGLSGVQQEVTRGTDRRPETSEPAGHRAAVFAGAGAVIVAILVIASAPLWEGLAFPGPGWSLVWPLAFGTGSFVVVAVIGGSLYGLGEWRMLGLLPALDAVLRLVLIGAALLLGGDLIALAWAVALPFALAPLLVAPLLIRRLRGRTRLDVGYRALVRNVGHTILAAAASGVMVSGFPLLLGLTSHDVPAATLGLVVLTVTLVRAPLIVSAQSLQSFFLVSFRDHPDTFASTLRRIVAVVVGCGAILALLGWLLGPTVFGLLFPGERQPGGALIAILVASSALVGLMCVAAPAVLARGGHSAYTAGWVAGALLTILVLVLPLEFEVRTVVALIVGPAAGLLVHSAALVAIRRRIGAAPQA